MKQSKREGKRIRLDAMASIIPYIMVNRDECQNHIEFSFDCGNAEKMVRELRQEGYGSIGMLHIIIAAYVRTIASRPRINRFIRGQKVYARNGITFNMVVKRKLSINTPDTIIKMDFDAHDTIYDIYHKVMEKLNEVYDNDSTDNDKAMEFFLYIPGLVKKFLLWLVRCFDYFGLIPKCLRDVSPFHGSLFITNLASLNIKPVCHHLYNFGTVPVFMAFGGKRREFLIQEDGSVQKRKVIDMIFNMDERICDGYYWASAFKILQKNLADPDLLKEPPEEVVIDG